MSYDNVSKYLAEEYPAAFVKWLLAVESPDVEILKSELTNEPIRADAVTLLRTANQILHIEFQTLPNSEPPIPFRMLDYSVRLKRKYHCEVVQVVIFLQATTAEIAFTEEYRDSTTSHRYQVLRLWEQEPTYFLAIPGLLPLATLMQTDSPEALLVQVAEEIAKISDREQRQILTSCTKIVAGLRFKKDLIQQLFREEIMRESVIYQDILQQGRQEEARSLIQRQLKWQLGKLEPSLMAKISSLSVEILETLGVALLNFSEVSDLVAWLKRNDPREAQAALITRQLTRRLGEIKPSLIEEVQKLSIEQLEALAEVLLDFYEMRDLLDWLTLQTNDLD